MQLERTFWLGVVALLLISSAARGGEAYLPDDDKVLETLPQTVLGQRDELTTLRAQLAADPQNAELAAQVARLYLKIGKRGGGPRYFGYARAALQPWWDAADAPSEVLGVRANLKETNHEFVAALQDVETLIERSPRDLQARIDQVNLLRVLGRYDQANTATHALSQFAEGAARVFCRAPLMAVQGGAEEAVSILDEAIPVTRENLPNVLPWMLTLRAEIARALGEDDIAEGYYRDCLRFDDGYSYCKRAYADFLLDRDRAGEVLTLLGDDLTDNGLLLAAAIAARRTGQETLAEDLKSQLADRFRETRLRGDLPHGRYEARFALELEDSPAQALDIALANWQVQKEMRDARNVLEAALAAGRPEAAAEVIQFLKTAGTEDVVLERLMNQLEAS